jgi:rhomboid family GlyGly-CTERM serine protease
MSDANRTQDLGVYGAPVRRLEATWLLGLIALAVVLLALGGDAVLMRLRYERHAVLDAGQYWRLLTAHLVHLSYAHAALNLGGLALVPALFPRHFSTRSWVVIALASAMAIDVGFVWNEPQLQWYAGLSGVLHGALAAGAIAWWRKESKVLASALTVVLVGKLIWEQVFGALPLSGDMPVVVAAHLYGAIGGAAAAAVIEATTQPWSRRVGPL